MILKLRVRLLTLAMLFSLIVPGQAGAAEAGKGVLSFGVSELATHEIQGDYVDIPYKVEGKMPSSARLEVVGGTAVEGEDYYLWKDLHDQVAIVLNYQDYEIEPVETVLLRWVTDDPDVVLGEPSLLQVTIEDSNRAVFSFDSEPLVVEESDGIASIIVNNEAAPGKGIAMAEVSYRTIAQSAQAGVDYVHSEGKVLVGGPGGDWNGEIRVPLVDDGNGEGSEQFVIEIIDPRGGKLGAVTRLIVQIQDDDAPSKRTKLVIDKDSYTISEGSRELKVTIKRVGSAHGEAYAQYQTVGNTAIGGQDYVHASGVVKFKSGETKKTITIRIINDSKKEKTESFCLKLTGHHHVDQAIIRIKDND
jgi:hypothetical protein